MLVTLAYRISHYVLQLSNHRTIIKAYHSYQRRGAMSVLHEYETAVDGWYKKSPVHLPDTARTWIANNAWWIILVGAALSILSVISSLRTLFWTDQVIEDLRQFAAAAGVDTGGNVMIDIGLWVSIITLAVAVIIELRAVTPLRAKRKAGWDLLVLASIVSLIGSLVSGILIGSVIPTILLTAIAAVISGFFLFEIRQKFLPATKRPKANADQNV